MNELKENEKERTKERERENQQQQRRLHARSSVLCDGQLTAGDVYDAADRVQGMTLEEASGWIDFMNEVEWTFSNGEPVTRRNFRRSLRMWHKTEEQKRVMRAAYGLSKKMWRKPGYYNCQGENYEEMERIKKQCAEEKLKKAMESESAWELCEERCAQFDAKRCPKCKHWSIPPQLRERPIPPEQCLHFQPKGE